MYIPITAPMGFYACTGRNVGYDMAKPAFHLGAGRFLVPVHDFGHFVWQPEIHVDLDGHFGTVTPLMRCKPREFPAAFWYEWELADLVAAAVANRPKAMPAHVPAIYLIRAMVKRN